MVAEIVNLQARLDATTGADDAPPWEIPPSEAYADEISRTSAVEAPSIASPEKSVRPPIEFRHIADIVAENREPEWLIHNILEREVLASPAHAAPSKALLRFIG